MLFSDLKIEKDKNPIVFIDTSGSTAGFLPHNNISILQNELMLVSKIFRQKGIENIYLMFWNDSFKIVSNLTNINDLDNKIESSGGTSLAQALKNIPNEWIENKEVTELYIFTDGDIQDSIETANEFKNMLIKNIKINIITVESNSYNYLNSNCQAGNTIYNAIRQNSLTNKLKSFISYNSYHKDIPFCSLNNPDVELGYAPFRDKCFKVTQITEFLNHIEGLIEEIKNDNDKLLKLLHELSLSVSYLTKNKSVQVQRQLIGIFSDLFSDTGIYKQTRELLLNEINNHAHGTATTFQAYKRNRDKVFETAQLALYDNVRDNITNDANNRYISLIMRTENGNDVLIKAPSKMVINKIVLSDKTYNNAGFNIGKYNIPMLPTKIMMDHDHFDQCVRQWIRANYSKKFCINPASDLLLYYFLADSFRIIISDNISNETKKCYKDLSMLMLDRKRFGTDITEYTYLLSNPPAPVIGKEDDISNILFKTGKHINITDVSKFTLWYAIVKSFGDDLLIKSQLAFCKDDMIKDNINEEDIITYIKNKLISVQEIDCSESLANYDYTCYLSLEDTTETGGYILPQHKISKKVICSPNFVVSQDGYDSLLKDKNVKCPICQTELDIKSFSLIKPKNEIIQEDNEKNNKLLPVLNEIYYDTTKCDNVKIPLETYTEDTDQTLYKMNDCNFNTVSYTIDTPYIQEPLGTRSIEVKTQDEFNNIVKFKYPFLSKMNWNNICLAGGFCRSILLKQKLKDFDFFHLRY